MPVTAEEKYSSWSEGICSGLELLAQVSKETGQIEDNLAIGRTKKDRVQLSIHVKVISRDAMYGFVPLLADRATWVGKPLVTDYIVRLWLPP